MKMTLNQVFIILLCCTMISCNTSKKVVYMQDVDEGVNKETTVNHGIFIQPKDILSIIVTSKYPELSTQYNLPLQSYIAGSSSETSSSYMQRLLGYHVDMEGYIEFPSLGKLKVSGMTRDQLSKMVTQQLRDGGLVKDAIVTTDFMNFKISVLGEVRNPGIFEISDDKITILEALGKAGDLTIYGRRDNVLVIREKNGSISYNRIDLRSETLFSSSVYYLQQNDVVYVTPNQTFSARSRINENKSLNVWISVASFLTSIAILVIK